MTLLPAVAQALTPPERDGTDWDALGASGEEIREFALGGLEASHEHRRGAALHALTRRGPTLGFRITDGGASVCYIPDHEHEHREIEVVSDAPKRASA